MSTGQRDGATEDIRVRLEALAEELADLALVRLRVASETGETVVPESVRRLGRARRAVERAVHLLDGPNSDGPTSDDD